MRKDYRFEVSVDGRNPMTMLRPDRESAEIVARHLYPKAKKVVVKCVSFPMIRPERIV